MSIKKNSGGKSIPTHPSQPRRRLSTRGRALLWFSGIVAVGGGLVFADWWRSLPAGTAAAYVGRHSCVECHAAQVHQWQGSYHDLAMDRATPETVLGNFDGAELTHYGITSRMFRQDGKFMVHTEGPDGKMTDFEVKYVFGVDPLQQYMVEFDRPANMPENEIARLQVLRISWDTEQKKWFYLPPPDVDEKLDPSDDLHWTGIAQRWNNMCADCHSTNLQKNFDAATNTYHTTFSEIDVSCEACHGPGSIHVQLARQKSLFWDRKLGYGLANLKDPNPDVQIQTCAQCHSRRRVVHPDYRPGQNYYDYFANELLLPHTYFADGQILDEVYVYASYIQSKMYHNKVRCTDCHDPHSTKVKFAGNQLCTSCHTSAHPAGKYDGPAHHHHDVNSKGALCVECHMPETTYMEVDPRRDHSLRIPRPDLSVKLGTPNACTRCHLDENKISEEKRAKLKQYRDWVVAAQAGDEEIKAELNRVDRWARDYTDQWYGPNEDLDTNDADALAAARNRDPSAEPKLEDVARDLKIPAVIRATAVYELALFNSRQSRDSAQRALKDNHPLVRATAVGNLESYIPSVGHRSLADQEAASMIAAVKPIVGTLVPLLSDPVRLVRTEAARVLARVPYQIRSHVMSGSERRTMDAALDEFKAGVLANNDRAGAHMTLGILYENLGDLGAAEDAYRTAIRVEPGVSGPRTNLAALLDQQVQAGEERIRALAARGDRAAAEQLADQLAAEIMRSHDAAQQLRREELELLARDARLAADNAAIQYRYGLSLYLNGRTAEAEAALIAATKLEPTSADFLLALVLLYQKLERWPDALSHAQRLVQLQPRDRTYQQLLEDIRQQATPSSTGSEP